MDKTLTKEKVKQIIDNAPPNVDKAGIIKGLLSRGYTLEGLEMQQKPEVSGTGFTPTSAYTGEENLFEGTKKALVNTPKSAVDLGTGIGHAITHPIETGKNLGELIKGFGASIGEKFLEHTGLGHKILEKANQSRIDRGLAPLQKDENGQLQAEEIPELQKAKQVGEFFVNRYGTWDNIKKTMVEDPVGFLADATAALTGGAGILGKAGELSKVAGMEKIAGSLESASNIASKTAKIIEPVNLLSKPVIAVASKVKNIPKVINFGRLAESDANKALGMKPTDVVNISKPNVAGMSPGAWMKARGFIKGTVEDIMSKLEKHASENYQKTRDIVNQVKQKYTASQLKRTDQALSELEKELSGQLGHEEKLAEIKKLRQKIKQGKGMLSDVQRTKELMDDTVNLYNKANDPIQKTRSTGLANVRDELKTFIEDEAKPFGDIKSSNKEVQVAHSIKNAMEKSHLAEMAKGSWFGDVVTGLAGYGASHSVLATAGIVIAKKIAESPAFRLKIANAFEKLSLVKKSKIFREINSGMISSETKEIINRIIEDAKNKRVYLAPIAGTLNKTNEK